MRVLFHIDLKTSKNSGPIGYARKEVELPCLPAPGTTVESSAWKRSRAIRRVVLNIDETSAFIDLEEDDLTSTDLGRAASCYRGHGWTLSQELEGARKVYMSERGLPDDS